MIEKTLVLSVDDLLKLTSFAHWIPILNGRHREFMNKNYPGWEWNQIIPVLVKAKILITHSKNPKHLALNQGLYIAREVESLNISIQDKKTEIDVRVISYPPCENP
jgi:hypothetical protein